LEGYPDLRPITSTCSTVKEENLKAKEKAPGKSFPRAFQEIKKVEEDVYSNIQRNNE
jgi:hypothetical protein